MATYVSNDVGPIGNFHITRTSDTQLLATIEFSLRLIWIRVFSILKYLILPLVLFRGFKNYFFDRIGNGFYMDRFIVTIYKLAYLFKTKVISQASIFETPRDRGH